MKIIWSTILARINQKHAQKLISSLSGLKRIKLNVHLNSDSFLAFLGLCLSLSLGGFFLSFNFSCWLSWFNWFWCSDWGLSLGGFESCLLLLKELREEFLISNMSILGGSPSVLLHLLIKSLSSESSLGDKSLDLRSSVEDSVFLGFFTILLFGDLLLNLSHDDVLSNIILLSKSERLSNVANSLWSESSWSLRISESWNLTLTFNQNFEEDSSKIWSTNATSNWLSLSLTSSSWSVKSGSLSHQNSDSTVDKNTLLHGESLFIISTGDSQSVTLELWSQNDSVNIGTHSSVTEVTVDLVIINFLLNLLPSCWVSNIILHLYSTGGLDPLYVK